MVQNRVTGRVTAGYKPDLAITTGKIRRSAEACPSRPPSETPESVTLARPDLNHACQPRLKVGRLAGRLAGRLKGKQLLPVALRCLSSSARQRPMFDGR